MRKRILNLFTFLSLALAFSSFNYIQAQTRAYRTTDRQLQTLLTNIETKTISFRREAEFTGSRNNRNNAQSQDLLNYLSEFESATSNLRQNFTSRRSSRADVENLLNRAGAIDGYLRNTNNNRSAIRLQNQWNLIRTDLNTLASNYNVTWNWDNSNSGYPTNPNYPSNSSYASLTGTYRLNTGLSDNVTTAVDRAVSTNNYTVNQRDRVRQNLQRRLTSPDMIAIEQVNRQVTIASSNLPQITLTADGTTKSETNANGRTVNTRAETVGSNLNISYEGDRANDFYLNFIPSGNNQLKVVRRLYLENKDETITVTSVYDRISQTAQWSQINNNSNYPNNNGGYPNNNTTASNDFFIPNGTKINAILDTPLSTKTVTDGERFTMTVRSPSQYDGAVIEGRVGQTQSSGRVSGRAEMSLNFEQIRLRNGRTYRFSGLIDSVRTADGDTININNEGAVRDGNQTTKTVTRAGIGAALGAVIGAIAGGGSGAAIGAGVGAGAGAGSVILQGRDNLELKTGTEFNLTSSAPANLRNSNY